MSSILSRAAWLRPYAWPFLALFAFNLLLFLAFTLPRSIQERRLANEAMALRQDLEARRSEVAAVRTHAQTVRANIAETARFYKEAVPGCNGHTSVLLHDLMSSARQTGVISERMATAPVSAPELPLTEIAITAPIAGLYQQVGAFLQKLEQSRHFLVVDSVQMRERREDGGAELTIKLNAYCHAEGEIRRRGARGR